MTLIIPRRRDPRQQHPGTRLPRYRCFLPDLAGFTVHRRESTGTDQCLFSLFQANRTSLSPLLVVPPGQ